MNMVASVSGAWEAFATKVGAFLPNFFYALFILIAGWILCNIAKRVVVRLLRIFRFDWLVERVGMARGLELGGIKQNGSEILGLLVFWFLFLIVIVATLEILGLTGATETLNAIFLYIPKVVAAVVVLILGLYFANFLQTVTRTSFINAGLKQADSMALVAYYAAVVFIVAAVLQILDIAAEIVMWAFVLIFGSICLALAIALGLGGKDVAARLLEKWLEGPKEQ
jgi:Mechanosensitive ion channel, conserved TM helix